MRLREIIGARVNEIYIMLIELLSSILVGFMVGGLILYLLGYNPLKIYNILFTRSLIDVNYLISKATPLMLTGLAFAIPLMAGLFNIGGESQLYLGALAGIVLAYYTHNPIIALVGGMILGGLNGLLVGLLRVYRGVNEVISTIMLNWIIYFIMLYLLIEILYNPVIPHESIPVPPQARIGEIVIGGESYRLIFFIGILAATSSYYIIYHTDIGYSIRVSGYSPRSAIYAGFNPDRSIIYSMTLAGIYAGLGGSLLVIGYTYVIDVMLSTLFGLGFMGIGVSLVGRNHPIGIIFSSLFFSLLIIGGEMIELYAATPPELADVLTGIIVISLSTPYMYRLIVSRIG